VYWKDYHMSAIKTSRLVDKTSVNGDDSIAGIQTSAKREYFLHIVRTHCSAYIFNAFFELVGYDHETTRSN